MNPEPERRAESGLVRGRLPWILVLAAALVARVAFVFIVPMRLLWRDARQYVAIATSLVEQGTYGMQTVRPPGYPTLIAGVFRLFGEHLVALRLVEAALATLTVGLIGWMGSRLFGRTAGWIAMALAALHPVLAFLPSSTYSESTSVLLFVLTFLVAFDALGHGGAWRWALCGVLIGLQILVRPNLIALLPGLGLGFALLLHRQGRRWWSAAAVTALAAVLTVTPWIVRSHSVHHEWFFVSTGGGRVLWSGNNPYATVNTTQPVYIDPETRAGMSAQPNEIERDRYLSAQAVAFMRAHPLQAARLYVKKLAVLFALYPETLTGTYVNPASRISQGLATVVLFLGVLLGLRALRSEPALWPLLGSALTFLLATAVAFPSTRYRMPVEPALILAAGVGFAPWLARLFPDSRGAPGAAKAAAEPAP